MIKTKYELVVMTLVQPRAGTFSPLFFYLFIRSDILDLSVFIDESGDFGPCTQHSPYYIIVLVFHEQSHSIQTQLYHLKQTMKDFGFDEGHAIHSAPLIRKERDHQHLERSDRKKLFHALFTFIRHSDVSYTSFLVDK